MKMHDEKGHRKDIDFLRALAVLLVIFFHLDIDFFRSGYIGVDIFFVISGYLITKNLKTEYENYGSIDLKNFYAKRFKRLFPSIISLSVFTLLIGSFILSPIHLQSLGKSTLSTIFSLSNILFLTENDYFDIQTKLKPLLHTWSLSVEEQFYIFYPILFVIIFKFTKKLIPLLILSTLGIISIYINLELETVLIKPINSMINIVADRTSSAKSLGYFATPFRIYEFMIGAILFLTERKASQKYLSNKIINEIGYIISILIIIFSLFTITDEDFFPSYLALIPCLGTATAIIFGRNSYISNQLSQRPIVKIGAISYSLYLFHWPVIAFANYLNISLTLGIKTLLLILMSVISYLNYSLIENKYRYAKLKDVSTKIKISFLTTIALIITISVSTTEFSGWKWRLSENQQAKYISDTKLLIRKFGGEKGFNYYDYSEGSGENELVVVGDSHARHYAHGLQKVLTNFKISVNSIGCVHLYPLENFNKKTDLKNCGKSMSKLSHFLKSKEFSPTLIISHYWISRFYKNNTIDFKKIYEDITRTKRLLGVRKLIVIGQIPGTEAGSLYDLAMRPFSESILHKYHYRKLNLRVKNFNTRLGNLLKKETDILFVNPANALCDADDRCQNLSETNDLFYLDSHHLSDIGSIKVIRYHQNIINEFISDIKTKMVFNN